MSREPSTPSASSGPSFDKEGDGPEPLDSLLRNLPGNIVRRVLHPDGRITYAFLSSGLRDTFDIEPGDITAQPDAGFEWIHPDDREGFRAALLHSAEALTPIDLENRVVGRDGAIRWVRSIATTRRLEDGRVIWDGIALDVTDKRRAEDEQKAALARAEAADDAKTKFLAAASHDLRQPLQAMRFLLSSLGAAGTDAARAAVLGDLERCLDATDTLLAALLDISKLDAGLIVPSNEIIALRPTLEAIVNEVTPMAEAAGLRLELRCQDGAVRTDPALLTSICRNLLHNAIKFSPSGAWVTVRANAGSRPRISIADEGPGIPAAERSRVFEPFVQLSNVARDRSQGLGLGLAIVARSAALLGAQIRLRSCEGRGSVFLLRLPDSAIAPAPLLPTPERQPLVEPMPLQGCTVWLLENDLSVQDALGDVLRRWGISVEAVASAAELDALAAARACPPDAVITDFRLASRRSGGQAVSDLRRRYGVDIPGLILTGDTDPERLRDAHSMRCLLLHKPVKTGRLKAALRACLNGNVPEATVRDAAGNALP